MPIRGRIAVDDQGRLVMIDPSADRESIDAADIQPLSVDDLDLSGQLTGESGRTVYDDATETVGDGQTSADHESVSTGSSDVGTVDGYGDVWGVEDRITFGTAQSQIQFSGLSPSSAYRIDYVTRQAGSATVGLRCNGDGDGTGDYYYWDESGTYQDGGGSGLGEMLIYESDAASYHTGSIFVRSGDLDDNREGFHHRYQPAGPPDRVVTFGREGARDNPDSTSSVELISSDNPFDPGVSVFELWSRQIE